MNTTATIVSLLLSLPVATAGAYTLAAHNTPAPTPTIIVSDPVLKTSVDEAFAAAFAAQHEQEAAQAAARAQAASIDHSATGGFMAALVMPTTTLGVGDFDADFHAYLEAGFNQGLLTPAQADAAFGKLRAITATTHTIDRADIDAHTLTPAWVNTILGNAGQATTASVRKATVTVTPSTAIGAPAGTQWVQVFLSVDVTTTSGKTIPTGHSVSMNVTPAPGPYGYTVWGSTGGSVGQHGG